MTKKEIIKEVATSLYLLIMFSKPAPGVEWDGLDEKVLDDTRAKAEVALKQAERVIGPLNVETVKEFMATRDEKFIIDCGGDVVVGDKIRFTEDAFDNRRTPSLFIGKRTVVAEVKAIEPDGRDMSLTLRIIRTSGSWPLAVGSESPRILQYITKFGISRIAWPNESKRPSLLTPQIAPPQMPSAAANSTDTKPSEGRGTLGRYDALKN